MYKCEGCGFVIDRDLNAAINLKKYAENTASSVGIKAGGEKMLQCLSMKPENNRKHYS